MSTVNEKVQAGVSLWTLDRPPVNAISAELLQDLSDRLDRCEADHTVRAVVIAARGPAFAAGADVPGFLKLGGSLSDFMRMGAELFRRLERSRLPIVAAVNGPCYGGGNELAMAADIRVASVKARFGQPEVNLGIIPGWGGTHRLAQLVGAARARRLLLTGESIGAEDAYRMGLIDEVIEPRLLLETALNLADRLASLPPLALSELKGLMAPEDVSAQNRETQAVERLVQSEDALEGIRAFMEHRRPRFTGR